MLLTNSIMQAHGRVYLPIITMLIGGGTIPTYITIKNLGLLNNPLVMIINVGVNAYYMLVSRQFFTSSIPGELYEAAEIDGCGEFRQFLSIALPLSKPIIAVIALYYAFGKWNSYYTALLYLKKQQYWSLQLVLRNLLIINQVKSMAGGAEMMDVVERMKLVEQMKYGIIVVASLPLMILYPFLQRFFTKGVLVGSIKG